MPAAARPRIVDPSLIPALKPAFPALTAGVIAAATAGIAVLAGTWYVVRLIGDPSPDWAVRACIMWLVGAALSSLSAWLSHHAEARFEARLRREVAGHLVRLPERTLTRFRGDALRRLVSSDIAALHHLVAHLPGEIATMVVVPAATIVLLVMAAGPWALLALIPGLLAALFSLVVIPRMAARHVEEQTDVMGEIASSVDDYIRGIHVSRIYGAGAGAAADYRAATARFIGGMVTRVRLVATPAAVGVALMQAAATFAIAYAVGFRWDTQTLAATLLFSLAIVTPALRLGHGLEYIGAGRAAMIRLGAVLREPVLAQGDQLAPVSGSVLEAVDLTIAISGRTVINQLTHTFRPASVTAVTGPSGAGKSTLLRALAGLEDADSGAVRLGAVNLAALDEDARHLAVLLIPQGGTVLPAPVRDTVALGVPEVTKGQLAAAMRSTMIDVNPNIDAQILSGGEKQRVGLARAFLSSAPVVLFDEPTSALDGETAAGIMAELLRFAHDEGRTVIIVTHDPDIAAAADARLSLDPAEMGETP